MTNEAPRIELRLVIFGQAENDRNKKGGDLSHWTSPPCRFGDTVLFPGYFREG